MRTTQQKLSIYNAFKKAGRPLSVDEVLKLASHDVPSLGIATVYREIKRLIASQKIAQVDVPGSSPVYEARELDHHHHHFKCNKCSSVYDIDGCTESLQKLLPSGFRMESHEIFIFGQCSDCLSSHTNL